MIFGTLGVLSEFSDLKYFPCTMVLSEHNPILNEGTSVYI